MKTWTLGSKVYHEDPLEFLTRIPQGSVDMVIIRDIHGADAYLAEDLARCCKPDVHIYRFLPSLDIYPQMRTTWDRPPFFLRKMPLIWNREVSPARRGGWANSYSPILLVEGSAPRRPNGSPKNLLKGSYEALIEQLIRVSTRVGDVILDLACGEGESGLVCLRKDRRFILIEEDKEKCIRANQRIELAIKGKRQP